ncbi:hypothetical protein PAAG_00431 [Paracoccidioides lutzii Pb01]|uniref:WHIM1 domain-containing protein n=1 Tax=Paracoccidioides lutzii (strain ATCC MYA-826 / Pb01) TaxID=502779 RepID=C1GPI6_PARBA|nr:hypothetical protein PAAG_00431 [Paracoccidioides lutzii Pb01]EEH36108.2 hypothetical protein PAAG_00431 [Paracoccidioides lutzii Pb01]
MSDSDSSSLSSAPSTDDETVAASINRSIGLEKYFKPQEKPAKPASPPPPKRAPSPPHEYVLADNPDIAFIVMFRSRFSDVFPKSLPHYGPQDIENGVTDTVPGDHIERLLCSLIGLCLNRKKDVDKGHYQRALEEVVQTHSSQWPRAWGGKNPLHGGGSFASLTPTERLSFLKALILWALSSSDAVQAKLKESYKQSRHDDDLNQPLSVQPWGNDAYKRRYWLIEGRDDTHFRLYRESNPALKNRTWWSVAGTIPELKSVADALAEEKSQHSKRLSEKIYTSIPRFEGSEEKRKRRDYRLARKAAFALPEPGFSLYEGRTRGKKLKYTYSDEDDDFSLDRLPTRKSTRYSRLSTPGEPAGPTFTASGRQVKARIGGSYGESMLSCQRKEVSLPVGNGGHEDGKGDGENDDDDEEQPLSADNGRAHRNRAGRLINGAGSHIAGYNAVDEMDEESEAVSSGDERNGGDEDKDYGDGDEDMSDGDGESSTGDGDGGEDDFDVVESGDGDGAGRNQSLVVQLRYGKGKQHMGNGSSARPQQQVSTANSKSPPDSSIVTSAAGTPSEQPSIQPTATTTTTGVAVELPGLNHHQQQPFAVHVPIHNAPAPPIQSDKPTADPQSATHPSASVICSKSKDVLPQVTATDLQMTQMDIDALVSQQQQKLPQASDHGQSGFI